jgi:hypothetical protein
MLKTKVLYGTIDAMEAASKKVTGALRSQVARLEARPTAVVPQPAPGPDPTPPSPGPDPGPEVPGPDPAPLSPLDPDESPPAI